MRIKRILLIISILLSIESLCFGQYTTVVSENICFQNNIKNGIVRNWTGTKFALTYSDGDGGVFRLLDYGDYTGGTLVPLFPLKEVPIPSQLDVIVDMRIMGDIACFCGFKRTVEYPYYSDWYIGCFKMSELVTGGSVNYRMIHIGQNCNLWKIEGFNDNNGFRVYALGIFRENVGGNWLVRDGILEIVDPLSATGFNYAYVNAVYQSSYHEFLDDIVVLEDKVVFVGRDNNVISVAFPLSFPSPAISMRKVNKSLGLADPQLDTNHHFYITPGVDECNSGVQAKPLSDDQFVIAYTYSPSNNSWRRIRVFDSMLNNINSQEYPLPDKLPMQEMVYNRGKKVLTILEPSGGTTRFSFLLPVNATSYSSMTLYDPLESHLSLDTISDIQFISSRNSNWLMQCSNQISYIPSVTTNDCLSNGRLEVTVIPSMNHAVWNDPPVMGTGLGWEIDVQPVSNCDIQANCVSK